MAQAGDIQKIFDDAVFVRVAVSGMAGMFFCQASDGWYVGYEAITPKGSDSCFTGRDADQYRAGNPHVLVVLIGKVCCFEAALDAAVSGLIKRFSRKFGAGSFQVEGLAFGRDMRSVGIEILPLVLVPPGRGFADSESVSVAFYRFLFVSPRVISKHIATRFLQMLRDNIVGVDEKHGQIYYERMPNGDGAVFVNEVKERIADFVKKGAESVSVRVPESSVDREAVDQAVRDTGLAVDTDLEHYLDGANLPKWSGDLFCMEGVISGISLSAEMPAGGEFRLEELELPIHNEAGEVVGTEIITALRADAFAVSSPDISSSSLVEDPVFKFMMKIGSQIFLIKSSAEKSVDEALSEDEGNICF